MQETETTTEVETFVWRRGGYQEGGNNRNGEQRRGEQERMGKLCEREAKALSRVVVPKRKEIPEYDKYRNPPPPPTSVEVCLRARSYHTDSIHLKRKIN